MIIVGNLTNAQVVVDCNDPDQPNVLHIGDVVSMVSNSNICVQCYQSPAPFIAGCSSSITVPTCPNSVFLFTVVGCDQYGWSNGIGFSVKEFTITTSIKESESLDFGMYPNPTSDFVTIKVKNRSNFDVFSMSGQLMMTSMLNSGSNSIDLTNLPTGVYSVRIDGVTKQLIRL